MMMKTNMSLQMKIQILSTCCMLHQKDMKPLMALPPKSQNIAVCNLEIPTILYNFVTWIISPKEVDYVKDRDVEVSESASRKVSSRMSNCATNA